MTLVAHPITATRKNAAVSATLVGHTTDPGVLAVTYPTGITGPATVTVAGTRTWGNIGADVDRLDALSRFNQNLAVEFKALVTSKIWSDAADVATATQSGRGWKVVI